MCENELDMKKELTVLELFVLKCETAYTYRMSIAETKKLKFLLSRLKSVPPSSRHMDDLIQELELRRDALIIEIKNMVDKFIANSIYKDILFEECFYRLSSKDIYNGYIPLFVSKEGIKEGEPTQYILFFRDFNNSLVNIKVGNILPDPDPENSIVENIEKSEIWKRGTKADLGTKHQNKLYAELINPSIKRRKRW